MSNHTTFDTLAANAVYASKALAVTYITSLASKFEALGNETDSFDAAYDDWIESAAHDYDEPLICWEIASDGSATDVTGRMEYERDMLREQRAHLGAVA